MRRRATITIRLRLNKQRNLGYVFVLIPCTLFMILFYTPADGAWMGAAIEDSQPGEEKTAGIKIIAVDPDGPAARAGLRVDDLVVLIDGKTVETCSSLVKIVREASEGTGLKVTILRKSERIIIDLILSVPSQHFILIQQGWEQAEKGNHEEAIRYFTEAMELYPKNAESYYSRGTAYFRKGKYDEAISDYTKALQINPSDAKAYYNRGITCCRKGQYDQAISDFNKALEINPMDADAYYNRGITRWKKSQHDEAISDFKKAFEINPNNSRYLETYVNHEIAYYEDKGQYDEAISDYTKALQINPSDAKTYINRGRSYYLKREYEKSWEDFRKALDLGDKVPPQFLDDLRKASGRQN